MTSLDQILAGLPGPQDVPIDELRTAAARNPVLIVLDDDPTGTQSVADLPVLCSWDVDSLAWAIAECAPAVYVMTNSRSLSAVDAEQRNREVARNAYAAADAAGVDITFVSRSDSTMRGHYPLEPQVLAEEMAAHNSPVDAVVIVPAFPDAGRITVRGVHYVKVGDDFLPAGQSEFARDATFGYTSSDLRAWVQEKSAGKTTATDVALLDLQTLRTAPQAAASLLSSLRDGRPVVVDIADEGDLRLLAAAMHSAQQQGSRFVIRCGPPFPRSYIGQEPRTPLTSGEVDRIRAGGLAENAVGGLVVVGSHVALTTSQLAHLEEEYHPMTFEIDVPSVLTDGGQEHVNDLAQQVAEHLASRNVVVRTSRTLVRTDDPEESLALSRSVSAAVVSLVQQVLARRAPRFVIAKGGITSSDVAAHGLSIDRAYVRGPMLPGIVSLWEPVDGPAKGIPYIVFAGNVGGPESLADVVDTLSDLSTSSVSKEEP